MSTVTEIEYYTNGCRTEPEGLTLMSRTMEVNYDDEGKELSRAQVIGMTRNVDGVDVPYLGYKPKRITKEKADALFEEMQDPKNLVAFGLGNKKTTAEKRRREEITKNELFIAEVASFAGAKERMDKLARLLGEDSRKVFMDMNLGARPEVVEALYSN